MMDSDVENKGLMDKLADVAETYESSQKDHYSEAEDEKDDNREINQTIDSDLEDNNNVNTDIDDDNNDINKTTENFSEVIEHDSEKEFSGGNEEDASEKLVSHEVEISNTESSFTQINVPSKTSKKKKKEKESSKTIFICYCPDSGFLERKLIKETVKELGTNGMSESIWFDHNENIVDTCLWMSSCCEFAEKCRACLLFFTESILSSPQSLLLVNILLERLRDERAVGALTVYTVLLSPINPKKLPKMYHPLFVRYVDLGNQSVGKSLSDRVSAIVSVFSIDLEYYVEELLPPQIPDDSEQTQSSYKKTAIISWNVDHTQEWLSHQEIREFYRQKFLEWSVDGFLLISLTERDMSETLDIDSRVVRKKLTSQVVKIMEKEHQHHSNWHLRCRSTRTKQNTIYLIFDPSDVRLAQTITRDLTNKSITVFYHTKSGQSREDFLQANGHLIAQASHVIVLLTENSVSLPFFYNEIMFSYWLGRQPIVLFFRNIWHKLRYSLKAALGDCQAIDFSTRLYEDSFDILKNIIKPSKVVPGVVLEQSYLNRMEDGVKKLKDLLGTHAPSLLFNLANSKQSSVKVSNKHDSSSEEPVVFISFHWDVTDRVKEIKSYLEKHGYLCWTDILTERGAGSSTVHNNRSKCNESLQSYIQRSMKAACLVITCITPKYVQSDNCLKDLTLADLLHKPVIPVMLKFCPWPPEGAPPSIKRLLYRFSYVDLSNPRLVQGNMALLLERINKIVHGDLSDNKC